MPNTPIPSSSASLSYDTQQRLTSLEVVIERNLRSFIEVGLALVEIRDTKLYRETHKTFQEYCQDRWGLARRTAHQYIGAAAVVENVRNCAQIVPANMFQARPLVRLSSEDQRKAWKKVVDTAPNGKITGRLVASVVKQHVNSGGERQRFSSLIKPSDNWNFSRVEYRRVDETAGHGFIPGDLYANCFWYFVKPGDLVVDPMAAAGMAKVVYDDRASWMGEHVFGFDLLMFDLSPQAPDVKQHDLLTGFPVKQADYIVIDPPYYGIAQGQYSDAPSDLANMSLDEWVAALHTIAGHCALAQKPDARCTVIAPNFRDIKQRQVVLATDIVRRAWEDVGYELFDKAYASRRIQQTQSIRMAAVNNTAKANKVMLADIAEVLTFQRSSSPA